MKKTLAILLLCTPVLLSAFAPHYYGARSLALGYSTHAAGRDFNAMFANPALVSQLAIAATGYQYQYSYRDTNDFTDRLNAITAAPLKSFEGMEAAARSALWEEIRGLFAEPVGMHGFRDKITGFAGEGLGFSVSFIDEAVVNPETNAALKKAYYQVSNADVASLRLRFLGLHYTRYSASLAMPLSNTLQAGVTLHYLHGKVSDFRGALISPLFASGGETKEYLARAWEQKESSFSKVNADIGLTTTIGQIFSLGVNIQNAFQPEIEANGQKIPLPRRYIAGLAMRAKAGWNVYMDLDITKTDLFHSGDKVQPLSLGVEKSFFQDQFFIRAGIWNDISQKHFMGKKSNILYGLGGGFNLGKIAVDFGMGVDGGGVIRNVAISGYFIVK